MSAPDELRYRRETRTLHIAWPDGARHALPAEYLRVESPSAEVQGHGADQKKIVGGKRLVAVVSIEPVGHYAVKVTFDDGHDTGLFTWPYLRELAEQHEARWAAYEAALAERGLRR